MSPHALERVCLLQQLCAGGKNGEGGGEGEEEKGSEGIKEGRTKEERKGGRKKEGRREKGREEGGRRIE